MALVTVNGQTAHEALIFTPRIGPWQVDARVADASAFGGRVTVIAGARTLIGTAVRSGTFTDIAQLRVVAGGAGLGQLATPRDYQGTTLGLVLQDLVSDAGEDISASADESILGTEIPAWTTPARTVGAVIGHLFATVAPEAAWRMLDDGTLWVGVDSFADAGIDPSTYEVVDRSYEENSIRVAFDGPIALIGTTFEGGKVDTVQDEIPQNAPIRTKIWFAANPSQNGARFEAALRAFVLGTSPGPDLRFRYLAPVVAQASGTVDVSSPGDGIPQMGGVPLLAQAGDSVDGVQGGSAAVGWAGDPTRRYAHGFTADAKPTTRVIAVLASLLLGDQDALPALVGSLHQAAEATLVGVLITQFGALATAATGPLAPLAAGFGAIAAALTSYQTAAQGANNFLSTKVGISP